MISSFGCCVSITLTLNGNFGINHACLLVRDHATNTSDYGRNESNYHGIPENYRHAEGIWAWFKN